MDLPITVIVLIVIALIILIILFLWTSQAKGMGDIAITREILRNCCSDRSNWDCESLPSTVNCNVPWSDEPETLDQLAERLGIDPGSPQLKDFCLCV